MRAAVASAAVLVAALAGCALELGHEQDGPHAPRRIVERNSSLNRRAERVDRWIETRLGRPLGHSASGRPIALRAFGNRRAPLKVLVFGCVHGTECAGRAVVRALNSECLPPTVSVWAVRNLNPDGRAVGSRLNGRGVDLNRNFSAGWRADGERGDAEYSGPRPFSEPETRLARNLVRRLRPTVTIWFHQQAEPLVRAWDGSIAVARHFAHHAELPFRRLPWLAGTAPNWQNHRFPETSSFVVELPLGRLDAPQADRYAAAIKGLATEVGVRSSPQRARRGARGALRLARAPYMGVACRMPNSTECDRVGLAVYLPKRAPAKRLEASINGRRVEMKVPATFPSEGTYFEGFLKPAGLDSGPLAVSSKQPVFATVRITAYYRDGSSRTTVRRVGLAPGWG